MLAANLVNGFFFVRSSSLVRAGGSKLASWYSTDFLILWRNRSEGRKAPPRQKKLNLPSMPVRFGNINIRGNESTPGSSCGGIGKSYPPAELLKRIFSAKLRHMDFYYGENVAERLKAAGDNNSDLIPSFLSQRKTCMTG